ncbi:MAG: hypothetical protein K6T59_12690 [Bryobacteraceae bacterium]|nr:hypothetical protein [Bryobacteraceae bacterium]
MTVLLAGLTILIAFSWWASLDNRLWSINVVDLVVVIAIGAVALLIFYIVLMDGKTKWGTGRQEWRVGKVRARRPHVSDSQHQTRIWQMVPGIGASLGVILTVFVAYAALRNQARLTAEIAIVADGGRIADWERESPEVRCLYDWFDQSAAPVLPRNIAQTTVADTCLARIIVDRDIFTEVMLYIEEAFFILRQAAREQKQWGSSYYAEVEYWKSDISEDVTGLFAFHLINRYPFGEGGKADALEAAAREMDFSDVKIANLCAGAQRVQVCLRAMGRFAEPLPLSCNAHIPISTDVRLVRLAAVCEVEASKRTPSHFYPPVSRGDLRQAR